MIILFLAIGAVTLVLSLVISLLPPPRGRDKPPPTFGRWFW